MGRISGATSRAIRSDTFDVMFGRGRNVRFRLQKRDAKLCDHGTKNAQRVKARAIGADSGGRDELRR